jgi:hypothetical protein
MPRFAPAATRARAVDVVEQDGEDERDQRTLAAVVSDAA